MLLLWDSLAVLILFIQGSSSYNAYCASLLENNQQPKSCLDLRCRGFTQSGVYTIYPEGSELYSFDVYCDQKTDGGGWTVSNSTKAKIIAGQFCSSK